MERIATKVKARSFLCSPKTNREAVMTIPIAQQEMLTSSLKQKSRSKWVAGIAKSKILEHLSEIKSGRLTLIEGEDKHIYGSKVHALHAVIYIHDSRFYGEIAFGGSIGAGEAYMLGYWSADNLTNVVRLMCLNQSVLKSWKAVTSG